MSNKKQKPSKKVGKKAVIEKKVSKDLLSTVDAFFDKRLNVFFYISLALTAIFAALLFDVRVSLTGDDAMYIIRASEFINEFKYPDFQGPLYPIVLSPFVAIFGINVIALKLVSFVFILGQITFFYFAFRKKVPATLLVITLILSSINAYLLYYAGQTYNEALFMVLQAFMMLLFFKNFITDNSEDFKQKYKHYLSIGGLLVLMGLTRSIGYVALGGIILYFVFEKKWKDLAFTTISFAGFFGLFQALKSLLWKDAGVQFKSQANSLLLKNYYNAAEGKEDFTGYLTRIVDNSQLYLSKHLYMMFGLREDITIQPNVTVLTILTYALFITALVLVFKKNKYLLFTGLYLMSMVGATFLVLQKTWDQGRFIVTYLPLIILFLFSALYYLSKLKKLKILQFVPLLLGLVLVFTSLDRTTERSKHTREVMNRTMNGNKYYGFTPDWTHYLQMSEWVGENIADSLGVACRKPSISFIYSGGRKFTGIFRLPTENLDTALNKLKEQDKQILAINMREMEQKGVPPAIFSALRIMNYSYVNGVKKDETGKDLEYYLYGIYQIPWASVESIYEMLNEYGINYSRNAEVFDYIRENKKKGETVNFSSISADKLLKNLKEKNVKYLILANLRKNPYQKNGLTINTVYRYLYFTQLKYPNVFRVVNQIGTEDDEPAQLVEVIY